MERPPDDNRTVTVSPDNKRAAYVQLLLLFLGALCLRLLAIYDGRHSPFFQNLIIDAGKYSQDALSLLAGHESNFTAQPYWQAPGYTWFLAAIYWVFGPHNLLAVRTIQAFLGASTCLLTFVLGRLLDLPYRASFAGAFLLAIYWPHIFFTTEIAIPVPFMFLVLLAMVFTLHKDERPSIKALSGLFLGIAALFRPNCLVLLLPLLLFIHRSDFSQRKRIEQGLALILGTLLFVLPITIRNFRRGGELVLISHNGGINLFIGNNERWKETFNTRPGPEWIRLVQEPVRRAGPWHGRNPAKASGYWVGKVLDYAFKMPEKFFWGMAEKVLLFLDHHELRRNTDIYFCIAFLRTLQLPLFIGFGLIGPLALVGLFFGWRREKLWFLALALTLYSSSIIVFFVCGRYRLPIVPFCTLFALIGLQELWQRRKLPHTFLPPLLLLLVGIYAAWGSLVTGISKDHSEALVYLARWQMRARQPKLAQSLLELAHREDPRSVDVENALALLLLDKGEKKRALELFHKVVTQKPHNYLYRANLGRALLALEDFAGAKSIFQGIIKDEGPVAEAYEGLAAHAMALKEYGVAEGLFIQARRIAGPRSGPRMDLAFARCLILLNKNVEATGVLLELLQKRPHWHGARRDLGHLYLEAKLYNEALYHFDKLESRSRQQEAERLALMGLCHYRLNEGDKARPLFAKARTLGHPLYADVCRTYGFPIYQPRKDDKPTLR